MNTNNWLERVLTLKIGEEERELLQKLAKNHEVYRLAGYSRVALALFILRSYNDIKATLEKNGYPTVIKQERK